MTIAKLSRLFIFLLLTCSCTLTWGDDPDENAECEESCTNGVYYYNSFSVQTITLEELQSQINIESALPYGETGKFYFYNNSLFVNEPQLGLHLLDVSNPTNIQKNNFIRIPGNIDLSIQNDKLYADLYSALLAVDISDIDNGNIRVEGTKTAVFDYDPYQVAWELIEAYEVDNDYYPQLEYEEMQEIEGLGETVFISGVEYNGVACGCNYLIYQDFVAQEASSDMGNTPLRNNVGQGGSLARFKIVDDYLYALSHQAIKIFRINEDGSLSNWSSVGVDWGIETLYLVNDLLFIGSNTGMFIYDIEDPGNPTFVSEYEHFRACDPVVAEGDYAYVTLRSTNAWCANNVNQLQIIDITNIFEPVQIGVYNMFAPYGLAVRGDRVWVCDAGSGIKIVDVSDKTTPVVVRFIEGYDARDIILRNETAYVVTTDGVVIYDISDIDNPVELGLQQF